MDTAVRDAYAVSYDERVIDGISGHYLPMASRLTSTSTSLICDDRRFIGTAEALLGGAVIPECPEGVLYFADAGWHNDDGIGVCGVKFAAYFEHLDADNGALRLMPGSHHFDQHTRLVANRDSHMPIDTDAKAAAYNPSFPGYVAETWPGDVIAFDLHTWHSSTGGRDRLAWTIVYQRCSERDDERERTGRSMHDTFEQAFRASTASAIRSGGIGWPTPAPIRSGPRSSPACGPPACLPSPAPTSAGEQGRPTG